MLGNTIDRRTFLQRSGIALGAGAVADQLPFNIVEPIFGSLRQRQLIINSGIAQLNDFIYTLTDQGRQRAKAAGYCHQSFHFLPAWTASLPVPTSMA